MQVDGSCPACQHRWAVHPVAVLGVTACVECVYEEDYQLRADICGLVPPGLAEIPASHFMRAELVGGGLRPRRLRLLSASGEEQAWALQRLGWTTPARADAVLGDVAAALDRLPVMAFTEWLRRRGRG